MEIWPSNEAMIWSVINSESNYFSEQNEMCETFYEHFTNVFGKDGSQDHCQAPRDLFDDACFSV